MADGGIWLKLATFFWKAMRYGSKTGLRPCSWCWELSLADFSLEKVLWKSPGLGSIFRWARRCFLHVKTKIVAIMWTVDQYLVKNPKTQLTTKSESAIRIKDFLKLHETVHSCVFPRELYSSTVFNQDRKCQGRIPCKHGLSHSATKLPAGRFQIPSAARKNAVFNFLTNISGSYQAKNI